jgi:membrane-bound serine protease (ClpP class)
MTYSRFFYGWLCLLMGLLVLLVHAGEQASAQTQQHGPIYTVEVEGVVTDVTVDYLRRSLRVAEASDATALIIQLGSEGAVLRAIRPFAGELAIAEIPVVVYVAPPGTESGAAGAFFLSAAHIAAMAPDSSFGTPLPLATVDQTLTEQTQELVLEDVSEQLRDWNEQRGRTTDWVDQGVREGVVRSTEQATSAEPPAIDITATDQEELLTLLQGRTVQLASGDEITLDTLGREPRPIEPTLWENLLLLLANPTVAFLLLMLGAVAVYAELATPGAGIAAAIGGVLLLGSLVGMVVLPVRLLSLFGLVLAFALIAADIYLPTHGGLTVAGLVLMIISAMTLIDAAQAPNVFVALWAILVVVLTIAAFAVVSVWIIVRTRNTPVNTGSEGLVGRLAEVRKALEPEGMVFVEGALWRAISADGPIEQGEWVRIDSVHDLRLIVRRLDADRSDERAASNDDD